MESDQKRHTENQAESEADRPATGTDGAEGDADQTPWLDSRQLSAWMAFSAVIIKLPAALDSQSQREAELNLFEYLVLAGLSEAKDRTLRMSTLAIMTNGSLSRLSHVVKRLEKRGFLNRVPLPEDGRYTNAVLTDEGWDKIAATAPGHVRAVRSLVIDALEPEQLEQLHVASLQILRALDPDTAPEVEALIRLRSHPGQ
jgi:DNA-binding MarR family transcriptional regulator